MALLRAFVHITHSLFDIGCTVVLSESEKFKVLTKMGEHIQHTQRLGVTLESIEGDELTLRLPYREELVGNPETGALHGGVLTMLLDQTLGMSAICSDSVKPSVTPTLDLRIDHLGIAPAGKDILATARVYRSTRRVLFAEGYAWCEGERDKPIARATGSWVRVGEVDMSWFLGPDHAGEPLV